MSYIVIIGQVIGSPGTRYVTEWSSDLEEKRTLRAAISHGFKTRGSDDFRIGKIEHSRLVGVSWMDKKQFDREEVIDTAEQLGLRS